MRTLAGGWKIENENNNVPKTKGCHLARNFGHGKKHRASLLMAMSLPAFALHTLLDIGDASYRLVRAAVGARRKSFQRPEAPTAHVFLLNSDAPMDFMMKGQEAGPSGARHAIRACGHALPASFPHAQQTLPAAPAPDPNARSQ